MPFASILTSLPIEMYWKEHYPEHFHAEYAEFKAQIGIKDGVVIEGELPARQLKLVLAWCEIHREKLLENWKKALKNGKIEKIEPLR